MMLNQTPGASSANGSANTNGYPPQPGAADLSADRQRLHNALSLLYARREAARSDADWAAADDAMTRLSLQLADMPREG